MTGKVVPLPPDPHRETQLLLPWYAAGRLDAADQARVEAHLRGCSRCRSELASERRLEAEVADLPLDVDLGWATMLRRIGEGAGGSTTARLAPRAFSAQRQGLLWAACALAAGVGLILVGDAVVPHAAPPGVYHTLAAAPPAAAGNVVVVFRTDATWGAITAALNQSHARVVDGPTGAGAYVLHVPAAERGAAVSRLRDAKEVEMAEPVDASGPP